MRDIPPPGLLSCRAGLPKSTLQDSHSPLLSQEGAEAGAFYCAVRWGPCAAVFFAWSHGRMGGQGGRPCARAPRPHIQVHYAGGALGTSLGFAG